MNKLTMYIIWILCAVISIVGMLITTARQWIKEYERLKSNGELDFIERYKN